MRRVLLAVAVAMLACAAAGQDQPALQNTTTEPTDAPSGRQTYEYYCASCHGEHARGDGPAAEALKTPPPDLTTLAKQHGGKFPYEYVSGVVRFGKSISAHGSSDMPVWGPIFNMVDYNEMAIRKRIRNLCDYLAYLQEK